MHTVSNLKLWQFSNFCIKLRFHLIIFINVKNSIKV